MLSDSSSSSTTDETLVSSSNEPTGPALKPGGGHSMNPTIGGVRQHNPALLPNLGGNLDFGNHHRLLHNESPTSFFKGLYDPSTGTNGANGTSDLFDSAVSFFNPYANQDPASPGAGGPTQQVLPRCQSINTNGPGLLMPVMNNKPVKLEPVKLEPGATGPVKLEPGANPVGRQPQFPTVSGGQQSTAGHESTNPSVAPPPAYTTAQADSTSSNTSYPGSGTAMQLQPQQLHATRHNGFVNTDGRRMSLPADALFPSTPTTGDGQCPVKFDPTSPSPYLAGSQTPGGIGDKAPDFSPGGPPAGSFPGRGYVDSMQFKHEVSAASPSGGQNGGQKAFIPCKVCGDKASGYHYGVTSCEGCKGFFRRSIQKQIEYRCLRDGKCMVFRLNRNRCQYCRFKKCLAVGMSRDSVRYGRVPKRSRDRVDGDARVSSMSSESAEADSELEKKQLALYDVILSVSQAHHSNCAYTDDKMKNVAQRPLHFPLDRCRSLTDQGEPVSSTALLEQQKIIMWETMALYTTPEIQRVVEFAKRIPGFANLPQEDQLVLIKTGFFEVWLVRVARQFNVQQQSVTMSDGAFVQREQLDLIYNPDLVAAMFNFAVGFNNLHLNDGEVGLFTAVVLLSQDRPSLIEPKQVERLQEHLTEALKLQLSRSHSSDPSVFTNLLMKIPDLRSVGAKHNDVLSWYRVNWRRLQLPPLYAEIYDIPKNDNNNAVNGHEHPIQMQNAVEGAQSTGNATTMVGGAPMMPLIHGNGYHHEYTAASGP